MKTFIIISVFICSLTVCNSKSKERDWIIVPGEKVGGITQNCTKKDLIDIFGKNNVFECNIDLSEGESVVGVKVFKDTSNELEILWKDTKFQKIDRIIIRSKGTQWKTIDGITIGTSLSNIVKMNEKEVTILGFEWDYAGTLVSWNNGKLEKKYDVGKKFAMSFESLSGKVNNYESVMGDKQLKSDNEVIKSMILKVASMAVIFE
ncbi:MAG TPA: hypothetical protein PK624_13415 [Spirochaetota bacterium]|nr:hypothetical protein [Spirochaetota bacterium]HOR45786.1 hypothetical protein [Spirochaetota bacterium]HOU83940.1 hypothetical protein [Spirochaetota bacterium]HPK57444.1 hypothetical protein [Spirochaetota bacterium]